MKLKKTVVLRPKRYKRDPENEIYREIIQKSKSGKSAVVQALLRTLKEKDLITEKHSDRLQDLVVALARTIAMSENKIPSLQLFAQLHDIGKVAISDSVLLKPMSLTEKEIVKMRRHCEIGHCIAMASPYLAPIAEWILKHHEWWDGSGYPLGLKGEEIPLECRILAIADAYDAMTSDRPYRKAMPKEAAIEELIRFSGRQFVPELVEKFIEIIYRGGCYEI